MPFTVTAAGAVAPTRNAPLGRRLVVLVAVAAYPLVAQYVRTRDWLAVGYAPLASFFPPQAYLTCRCCTCLRR